MENEELSKKVEELGNDLNTVATTLRWSEAQNVVKNNVMTSMGSGLVPIPLFDIIVLTNIQFHMIQTLAELYEVPVDNINKSLVTSLISGALPVASVLGMGSLIKSIPGIGSLAGSGSVAISSGAISYAVGQVFIRHFEQGGTLSDFNAKSARDYFSEQAKAGKSVARELMHELKQHRKQKNVADPVPDDEST